MLEFSHYKSDYEDDYFMVGTSHDIWSLGPMFNGTNN